MALNRSTGVTVAQQPSLPAVPSRAVFITSMVVSGTSVTFTSATTTTHTYTYPQGIYPYNPDGWYQGVVGEGMTAAADGTSTAVYNYCYS